MEGLTGIQRWAITERFGKVGETYEQVVARISLELLPVQQAREFSDPLPVVRKRSKRKAKPSPAIWQKRQVDVPVEDSVSVVSDIVKSVRVKTTRARERPPVALTEVQLMTMRMEQFGMRILSEKE